MFSKKSLRVEIQNLDGEFKPGVNTLSFRNLPMEVNITLVEAPACFSANIKIYGVSSENMNYITTLHWQDLIIIQKGIRIYANDGDGEFLLYEGNIQEANPIYDKAPDVYIDINTIAGAFYNMKGEVPPLSLPQNASVPDVFKKICSDFGIGFVNKGVEGMANETVYFDQPGLMNRIYAASKAYNVSANIYDNYVEIYPPTQNKEKKDENRKVWTFMKQNYIGYPSFANMGIKLTLDKLYPVKPGDVFKITGSEVKAANASFETHQITYSVSTKIGGKWFMTIYGTRYS